MLTPNDHIKLLDLEAGLYLVAKLPKQPRSTVDHPITVHKLPLQGISSPKALDFLVGAFARGEWVRTYLREGKKVTYIKRKPLTPKTL